jgi:alpha-beta hydrolase superfamily lysophospholipase
MVMGESEEIQSAGSGIEFMSADPHVASTYMPGAGLAEALYFDSGEHQLFGWLHRPSVGTIGGVGLVACNPFGYEAICSHRSVRAFADAAAKMGVPALRFDYAGTGDSADIDPESEQTALWCRDIESAVNELQKRTGVERVCLLGFRLGALLAMLAAKRCKSVSGLVLVAPIIDGKRYLREIRTTNLAARLGLGPEFAPAPTQLQGTSTKTKSLEVSGFSFSAATLSCLAEIDLSKANEAPALEMFVIDSHAQASVAGWIDTLTARGAKTGYQSLPGVVEMLMTDPQFSTVSLPIAAAISDWLGRFRERHAAFTGVARESADRESIKPAPVLRFPGDGPLQHAVLFERPVIFGVDALLFGIVTEPPEGDKRRRGVILLNVGAEHHIGSSRIYVSLARHWAQRGYTVLRLDLAGLGDSATRPGRPDNEVFPPGALDDIRAAIELLRSRYASADITLGGLCSGAYHSLRAAVAALPVNRILLVNPMNFLWSDSLTADNLQSEVDVARNVAFYRERIFSAAIWKRIFSGQLNIARIVRIMMRRPLLIMMSRVHDLARGFRIHLPGDLGWELQQLGARGVRMIFVFARGEPGIDVLKLQAGSSIKRLGEFCHVHVIDSADHIFSRRAARGLLERILSDELFAQNPWRREIGRPEPDRTR